MTVCWRRLVMDEVVVLLRVESRLGAVYYSDAAVRSRNSSRTDSNACEEVWKFPQPQPEARCSIIDIGRDSGLRHNQLVSKSVYERLQG